MTRPGNRHTLVALVITLGLSVPAITTAQDVEFYEAQLRAGHRAFRTRQLPAAIDHYRVAAFGFLNQPNRLSEALVRLALAQQDAGRSDDLGTTLERFLEVERRFSAFGPARLDNQTRSSFRRLLEGKVPPRTLAAILSLSHIAAPPPVVARSNPGTPAPAQVPPSGGSTNSPAAAAAPQPIQDESPPPAPVANVSKPEPEPRPSGIEPIAAGASPIEEPPRYQPTRRPVYPPEALRNRIGGIVILRVLVSENGEPTTIEVVRSVHPHLSAAAVSAVRHWNFEPARRNGIAVAGWATIPIPFRP